MFDNFNLSQPGSTSAIPILIQKQVARCHVVFPDTVEPTSAIFHRGCFYVYVKFFSTLELAHRAANRLIDRGNAVVLTRIPKGLVLWVLEPEAQLAQKRLAGRTKTEKYR